MNEEMQTIDLNTQKKYWDLTIKFFESYTPLPLVTLRDNQKELKKKSERTCRFCGKSAPQSNFSKKAHLIPEFLGNQHFLSDFECNNCNEIFSKYDDSLASLVGAERAINKVKGKQGIPKFRAPAKALEIKAEKFYNKESIQISRPSTDNETFRFDKKSGKLTISYKRNPYIPNSAYKCLLKIALSLLPEATLDKYEILKRYLIDPSSGDFKGCSVIKYSLPFGIEFKPHAILFQKNDASEETMTHMLSFYCMNYIFWVPIPLHKDDLHFHSKAITLKIPPPLFVQEGDLEHLQISFSNEIWDSTNLKKGETQELNIIMNNVDLENSFAIDTKTGEQSKRVFNHEEIISLILCKDDGTPLRLDIKQPRN